MNYLNLFMLFYLYSIIGFLGETFMVFIRFKKITYRGFLIGPCLPVYGIGALIIYYINLFIKNPFLLFFSCIILFSLLEYFTSFILEKIFNARWWDYSKEKYNLNGRICLNKIIQFGISGIITIYFINPFLFKFISYINNKIIYFFIIIFLLDVIISFLIIKKIKVKNHNKDNTEEISNKVKNKIKKELKEDNI